MNKDHVEIVIVEDDPNDAELIQRVLKKHKLVNRFVHLKDGAEALDYFFPKGGGEDKTLAIEPKVILLDLKLPKVSGMEVLMRLKSEPRLREIPVVVLSSSRHDRDLKEAYVLGANSYVTKPINYDEFAKAVAEVGLYWLLLNRPCELPGVATAVERSGPVAGQPLHVLMLEDEEADAELVQRELRKAGLDFKATWAADQAAFLAALEGPAPDIVLADYSVPGFDGLTAIKLARQRFGEVPGIIVSGAIGEEAAIDAIRGGATDYVLKNRLGRLGPVVQRALDESRQAAEKRRAEEDLRAAKISAERAKGDAERWALQAEEASRAKDRFLAVLSHELRNPLTPVLAAVSVLQRDARLQQIAGETLEVIRRNVELESRLIDDLLDVTRISQGKVELDKRPVSMCSVLDRAVEVCRPDIESRRLHFSVKMGEGRPFMVEADVARLQQVFWNLLKNAVKFTPDGGCVGVSCRRENGQALVEVTDSGIGIEADAMGRIFNAFEQAERSITRQFGGLGLGLSISKAMVELHSGTIEARSMGKGKGATFTVRLPLFSVQTSDQGGSTDRAPPVVGRHLKILLVEDHGDTAKMMQRLLMLDGHEVRLAGDVATALMEVGQHTFDLILSDLGLPDATGVDLIRELRVRGFAMPAIALSGYGQEEDIRRSKEAGFNAHLTKPTSPDRLSEAIASVTGETRG